MLRPALAAVACLALVQPQAPTTPVPPSPPPPADLLGRIDLKDTKGAVTPAAGSVVWVPGTSPGHAPGAPTMTSREKRFDPHVIAVPAGANVAFPNVDGIYHNVFSRSETQTFDLGLYRKGASRSMQFSRPGLVRVYCNIHPDMAAFVMVVDGAYAVAREDGTYHLAGIPPGRRRVRVWNEKAGDQEFVVTFEPGGRATLDAVLDGSRYRLVAHKNKYGKDYPPV